LGLEHSARVGGAALEIDRRAIRAQMKTHGMEREYFLEDRGEQVLTGMLLHVIEPAGPIDDTSGFARGKRRREAVGDAFALIGDLQHGDSVEGPNVKRLPAGRRIKGGT